MQDYNILFKLPQYKEEYWIPSSCTPKGSIFCADFLEAATCLVVQNKCVMNILTDHYHQISHFSKI